MDGAEGADSVGWTATPSTRSTHADIDAMHAVVERVDGRPVHPTASVGVSNIWMHDRPPHGPPPSYPSAATQ